MQIKTLIFLLVSSFLAVSAGAQTSLESDLKQSSWAELSIQQQAILAPLSSEWGYFSELQRKRILKSAKAYPQMTRMEQERYSARILRWSKLSMEERNVARARYLRFRSLPREQRDEIKHRWTEQQRVKSAAPVALDLSAEPNGQRENMKE